MTYCEFKYQVRKLGLGFFVLDTTIAVGKNKTIYYISTKQRFVAYPKEEFYNLDECLQHKLFILVFELARTSLDERGDPCKEHKWYLKHKYLNTSGGENYLCENGNCLFLRGKRNNIFLKFKFTKYDIEELQKLININEFEQEKVE